MIRLPINRQIKKLGELCQIKTGKKDANYGTDDGQYPFFTCGREVIKAPDYSFDTEAILIAGNGDVGACKYYKGKFEAYQRTYVLDQFEEDVFIHYVFYLLNGTLKQYALQKSLGSAIPYIKIGVLQNFQIPLPPLSTQQAIVAKLDQIHAEISANQSAIHQQLAQLDELWQSSLDQIFSNEEWEKVKLGDDNVVEIIDGDRGTNYPKKSDFTEKGYCLFLNTSNVRKGYWNLDKLEFISKERDELLRKGKTQKEDIVLTTRGTIGNCAFINEDFKYEHVRINSGMVILRVNLEKIFPNFLLKILLSPLFLDQVTAKTSGSAQPQLPIRVMKDIEFPLPDLATQKAAVAKLDQIHEHISQLRADYTAQLAQYEELRASVLDQAFKGQLVE